ncbi:uncharacterized protein LOC126735953 [Anthonomus grandis grandis]|uniref:uncharacterized protein LOC126735953 n=1 Tax=Anthonomus grandis grandis TaxID=2921223 RepID=UPI0021660CAE|nr:uncharacterized protein LOC126735953 [Anthonomus grandis grandis]
MSSVELSASQKKLIKNAVEKNGISNATITADVGSIKGDNYLGIIHTVIARADKGDEGLHFILKSAPSNEHFRKRAKINKLFKHEAYLYETAIGSIQEFQQKFNLKQPFTGAAKYYGCILEDGNESILMENLKEYGYNLWERTKPMDDAHITAVFTEYARFHAASMAFRHKEPEKFNNITKEIDTIPAQAKEYENTTQFLKEFIGACFTAGSGAVAGNEKATKALERLKEIIIDVFEACQKVKQETVVILHGDCWCNNILFKYKDETKTKPSKVCFIDWQLSRLGSPIIDLAYFFFCATSKETLPNLNQYLKTYHDTLSEYLRDCDCDPEEIYSFNSFMKDWKKLCMRGICVSLIMIKVMLSDSEEAPDLTKENGGSFLQALTNFDTAKEPAYKKRVCDILEFMTDNGYF